MAATAQLDTTSQTARLSPVDAFDEYFVQPCAPQADCSEPPALPTGWRHSAVVAVLADQPRERREALFAVMFAGTAALWAPLGVMAVLAGRTVTFFLVTLVAVIVMAAPRPTALGDATASLGDVSASLGERLRPAMASARDLAGGLVARTTALAAALSEQVKRRATESADRIGDWSQGHRIPRSTR